MRRRQVQRGAAELYLSSYRINNAEESAVDYRVQLQRNVDEEGGKYTEAQPRCTWPLSESTLRQGRWGPPPLLSDFRLVHWRNPSLFFYRTLFIPADCHPHLYRAQKRETYLTANTMSSGPYKARVTCNFNLYHPVVYITLLKSVHAWIRRNVVGVQGWSVTFWYVYEKPSPWKPKKTWSAVDFDFERNMIFKWNTDERDKFSLLGRSD